jgi:glycolate oxidase FAD binding subunit
VLEHNVGDLTAVVQAGVPMTRLQGLLGEAGQMLAIDPPVLFGGREATLGGVLATGDSGPLRHRYGAPRDLVLGMTIALSDGTVARSGGKVIKNVAGYDLGKLFTGSFGTLGLILSVSVRLHPLPAETATARGATSDPDLLGRAAGKLAAAPLELESLDVAWRRGRGGLLACCGGAEAAARAGRVAALMRQAGLDGVDVTEDDSELWDRQRAGQRSDHQALVRIEHRPSVLASVLGAVDSADGTLVGRAALGTAYVALEPEAVDHLRTILGSDVVAVVLDGPERWRADVDVWGGGDDAALGLMRRVKERFDPSGVCNPGIFVGGI